MHQGSCALSVVFRLCASELEARNTLVMFLGESTGVTWPFALYVRCVLNNNTITT